MPPDARASSGLEALTALTNRANGIDFGAFASDLLGSRGSSSSLFVGILRSRTVQDRLVDQFNLREVSWESYYEDARNELAERTTIAEDRKSGIVAVSVVDRDPLRAAALANAYVAELNRLSTELATSAARRERVFIEERLRSVRVEMDSAAREFSEFASKNATIEIRDQGRAMIEAASRLQGQIVAAEAELEGLKQIYAPSNIRVRSVHAKLAELKRQLATLSGSAEGGANSVRERSMLSDYPSIRGLPLLAVKFADLYRQTRVLETVFELLTQNLELAKVQEAKEIPSVRVLDAAVVPERKSSPPRTLIVAAAGIFGLLLGSAWILSASRWGDVPPDHPGKVLTQVVIGDLRSHMAMGRGFFSERFRKELRK